MSRYKQRFSFTCNALSRSGFFSGIFQILTFRAGSASRRAISLLADYFGVSNEQVFLFGAGRMSVYSLIRSMNLQSDDEVIVAGYTCVVLTNAVKFAGCKVSYVDIDRSTLNVNTDKLLGSITEKTKVVIVPHNFGIPFTGIEMIKAKHPEIIIIEDAAHTFGSELNGKKVGTVGDASFFSLEYSKPLTTGLGGIMIINNRSLLEAFTNEYNSLGKMPGKMVIRIMATLKIYALLYFKRTVFFQAKSLALISRLGLIYRTSQKEIDGQKPDHYPVKLNNSLAVFLIPQLKNIGKINAIKRKIISDYHDAFKEFNDLEPIDTEGNVLVRYPIVFKENVSIESLDKIKQMALEEGFNFGVWFNDVVHPAGSYRYCYVTGSCPDGEYVAQRIVNLPVNANQPLDKESILRIKAIFKKCGIK